MNPIIRIFMDRDEMTYDEALDELEEMQAMVEDGEDPEEILYDYGLEPDYLFDLLED